MGGPQWLAADKMHLGPVIDEAPVPAAVGAS